MHNADSQSKWNHPLNGGMILGLTATYHFLRTQVGNEGKKDGFNEYLVKNINRRTVDKFIEKTQGPIMDIRKGNMVILRHVNLQTIRTNDPKRNVITYPLGHIRRTRIAIYLEFVLFFV